MEVRWISKQNWFNGNIKQQPYLKVRLNSTKLILNNKTKKNKTELFLNAFIIFKPIHSSKIILVTRNKIVDLAKKKKMKNESVELRINGFILENSSVMHWSYIIC